MWRLPLHGAEKGIRSDRHDNHHGVSPFPRTKAHSHERRYLLLSTNVVLLAYHICFCAAALYANTSQLLNQVGDRSQGVGRQVVYEHE